MQVQGFRGRIKCGEHNKALIRRRNLGIQARAHGGGQQTEAGHEIHKRCRDQPANQGGDQTKPLQQPLFFAREQPGLDGFADSRRRGDGGNTVRHPHQFFGPDHIIGTQQRLADHPGLKGAGLGRGQQTQRIFRSHGLIVLFLRFGCHDDKHSLNFSRLRRSQVRMVLSGCA